MGEGKVNIKVKRSVKDGSCWNDDGEQVDGPLKRRTDLIACQFFLEKTLPEITKILDRDLPWEECPGIGLSQTFNEIACNFVFSRIITVESINENIGINCDHRDHPE